MGTTSSKKAERIRIKAKKLQLGEEEEQRPWRDLPPELVSIIVKSLSFADYFNFKLVFPNSGGILPRIPIFPSMLRIENNDDSRCSMFKFEFVNHTNKTECLTRELSFQVSLLSSGYGWLLLCNYGMSYVFFYNPLTMDVIRLPHIKIPFSSSVCISAPPTSPQCMVFCGEYGVDIIRILFCCHGDDKWTELYFRNKDPYIWLSSVTTNSTFHKGKVYWVGMDRRVGVFDPVAKSWLVHGNTDTRGGWAYNVLVQSGDDLFTVSYYYATITVYKLDWFEYQWMEAKTLDGRCFFVSFYPSITFSKEALRGEEDKIYFHSSKDRCLIYDACQGRVLNKWDYLECPYLGYCCWVDIKWDCHSFKELQWFQLNGRTCTK